MHDPVDRSIHVVSAGDDPDLLRLASLLQASHVPTVVLQADQGLQDLIDLLGESLPSGGFDAIHLYGHGTKGKQSLGRDSISSNSLQAQGYLWSQLNRFVHDDSDLLIYGCKTGAGNEGSKLIQSLAQLTGLDVAASDDITGLATRRRSQDSDWDLEMHVGRIEARPAQRLTQWDGTLQLERSDDLEPYPFRVKPVSWEPSTTKPDQEFAVLKVPLDYDQPRKRNAKIALARIPASGKKPIGSLIFNPGGPGGSGLDELEYVASVLTDRIRKRFHIVTFDPRGVGSSTPTLKAAPGLFPILPPSGSSDWTQTLNESREIFRQANIQTQIDNQEFINHLGTRNVARDLELIRQAIGDQKLNYLGFSYGTRIGYTYAAMFPDKIRALVLDGNVNPSESLSDFTMGAKAPDIAMNLVREKEPMVAAVFDEAYGILEAKSIDIGGGLEFSLVDYIQRVSFGYLASGNLGFIEELSGVVIEAASGGDKQEEAKITLSEVKGRIQGNENAGGLFAVVNRLDYGDSYSEHEQLVNVRAVMESGPLGGPLAISYAAGAAGFDLRSEPVPDMSRRRLRQKVSGIPVLITNATADAETPRFWAVKMTKAFANHSFIEFVSTIHCIIGARSSCVNGQLEKYLIKKQLPTSRICAWANPNSAE
jgi:pimeloyl-ACP methyl ester carboxylesterase